MRKTVILIFTTSLVACNHPYKKNSSQYIADSAMVSNYITTGDKIYARKANYESFLESMEYYDSAFHLAQKTNDTLLIAQSVFAKGRAYDAINNNPQKTIQFYKEAAQLYVSLPGKYNDALYIKHLVAHSYDKVNDSTNCITVLTELFNEISGKPDSIKKQLRFTAEMALISTVVKNYSFADSILNTLTKREWIENDKKTYDYLNHYYLTKARLEVYKNHRTNTPYLDSVEMVYNNSTNFSDSAFFSNELRKLFADCNNKEKEMLYKSICFTIADKMNDPATVQKIQDKLSKMEVAVVENQKNSEQQKVKARTRFAYILAALLLVITGLVVFLINRNREIKRRKNEAEATSKELYQKNIQNELLNKELHHRVKNNLQMVLSLVYMQERKTETEETKTSLQDIRFRIESIAALHQQLMEQNDDVVDLKNYITQLVNSVASLVSNGHNILTHLEVDNIKLPVKQSFPLGLMLNEWITNTLKHAKAKSETLSIYITIKKENKNISINYKDSGIPVNKTTITSKLGMSILDLLTAQLNGAMQRDEKNYFSYQLNIPADGE